jgi:rhodanese-related sulfurtransferase
MIATITRDELREKLARRDKFALVETLAVEEYRAAHLPSALNLPPEQVAQSAPKLLPDKAAEIVVYCRNTA